MFLHDLLVWSQLTHLSLKLLNSCLLQSHFLLMGVARLDRPLISTSEAFLHDIIFTLWLGQVLLRLLQLLAQGLILILHFCYEVTTYGCQVAEGLHNQLVVVACLSLLQLGQKLGCQLWLVVEQVAIVLLHGASTIVGDAFAQLSRVLVVTLMWLLVHGDWWGWDLCSWLGCLHLSISALLARSLNVLNVLGWERVLVRRATAVVVV